MISINDKVCGCGTFHDHANKAARLMARLSEEEKMCPLSKLAVAQYMVALASSECLVSLEHSGANLAEAHEQVGNARVTVELSTLNEEFVDILRCYLTTAATINLERNGLKDTAADDMLAGVVKKRKGR